MKRPLRWRYKTELSVKKYVNYPKLDGSSTTFIATSPPVKVIRHIIVIAIKTFISDTFLFRSVLFILPNFLLVTKFVGNMSKYIGNRLFYIIHSNLFLRGTVDFSEKSAQGKCPFKTRTIHIISEHKELKVNVCVHVMTNARTKQRLTKRNSTVFIRYINICADLQVFRRFANRYYT